MAWYPGDNYVDWFAVSVFKYHVWDYVTNSYLESFISNAKVHYKPVMIAESDPTPPGGITNNNYETWNRWFVPYISYIYRKNIKAFSYINCDWDVSVQFGTWGWGNCKTQDYPLINGVWTNEIKRPEYLKASPNLFKELGWTN